MIWSVIILAVVIGEVVGLFTRNLKGVWCWLDPAYCSNYFKFPHFL